MEKGTLELILDLQKEVEECRYAAIHLCVALSREEKPRIAKLSNEYLSAAFEMAGKLIEENDKLKKEVMRLNEKYGEALNIDIEMNTTNTDNQH